MLQSSTPQEIKRDYPLYPEVRTSVEHIEGKMYISFETLVRLKREETYYLFPSRVKYAYDEKYNTIEAGVEASCLFIKQVVHIQNFFLVDLAWSIIDDDQTEEAERLMEADPVLKRFKKDPEV